MSTYAAMAGGCDPGPSQPPLKRADVEYNVPVKNTYNILDEPTRRKISHSVYEEVPAQPAHRTQRMPPIIVPIKFSPKDGMNTLTPDPNQVRACIHAKTKEYTAKNDAKGLILFGNNQPAHQQIIDALKSHSIQYFSHPLAKYKPKRFVLYGLCRMNQEKLAGWLKEVGLEVEKINYMATNNPRFTDQCNYIVHFNGTSSTNISALKEIRALHNTIVHWAHYKIKKPRNSVCRNCCSHGHGMDNCGLSPKCIICADNHNYLSCPYLKKKHEGNFSHIHNKHIKCAGCGANHTATFPDCPGVLNISNR